MTGRRTTVGWNPPLTALAVCLALGCGIAATPAQVRSAVWTSLFQKGPALNRASSSM